MKFLHQYSTTMIALTVMILMFDMFSQSHVCGILAMYG